MIERAALTLLQPQGTKQTRSPRQPPNAVHLLTEVYARSARAVASTFVSQCVNALQEPGAHAAAFQGSPRGVNEASQPWPQAGPMALMALSVGMAKSGMASPTLQVTLLGGFIAYGVVILPVLSSQSTSFLKPHPNAPQPDARKHT